MIPENDNAQEQALEALIAASLRPPGKQPEITEDEIKRFVDQQVTMSAEDEAALAKAKPSLMRAVGTILSDKSESVPADVKTSAEREGEIRIPKSLLTLGKSKGLMLDQMLVLLNMRLQVKGHRSDSLDDDLEAFDWERFYDKVKDYIK